MINSGKAQNLSLYKVIHLSWAAKCRPTLTCGILTAVIVGRHNRPTALAVIGHHRILLFSSLTITVTCRGLDGDRHAAGGGGNVGSECGHVCRRLNGLNR